MPRRKEDRLTVMPLNVSDLFGSAAVQAMSDDAAKTYLWLLAVQWNRAGRGLPRNVQKWSKLGLCTAKKWNRIKAEVVPCFVEREGAFFNERLHEEWLEAQERKRVAIESGRAGGRKSGEVRREGSLEFRLKQNPTSPSPSPSSPKKKKKPLAPLPRGTIPLSLRSHEEKYSELADANDWFGFPGWNARTVKRAKTLPDGFWNQVVAQVGGINEDRAQSNQRAGWPWLTHARVVEKIMGGEFGRGKRTSFTEEELREMDRKRGFDV